MFQETNGSRKTIGDIDVIYHDGIYHLFHLVLPNHDYIAHAISNDCLNWRRVENALFIGHPGSWDDAMLWTMHVSPHPGKPGTWRMFYTGLSRCDAAVNQRIGVAESDDLFVWTKQPVNWKDRRSELPYHVLNRPPQPPFEFDPESSFPLTATDDYYESDVDSGRMWCSWRDPYYYRDEENSLLLVAARTKEGPLNRRGCVAQLKEVSPGEFVPQPPLLSPRLYDDIEVPNLIHFNGYYYLIGSIREDSKVHYWYSENLEGHWKSFSDNVLLPTGNYAGRVIEDDRGYLLWSFFSSYQNRVTDNLMLPPKRIACNEHGELQLQTYEKFDDLITATHESIQLQPVYELDQSEFSQKASQFQLRSEYGVQLFLTPDEYESLRFDVTLQMTGEGKCGIVLRIDQQSLDGYYLSIDLFKGIVQFRRWGHHNNATGEHLMQYDNLQSAYWFQTQPGTCDLKLIAHGNYMEVSINGAIMLTFADQTYRKGKLGVYVDSGELTMSHPKLYELKPPMQSAHQLASGKKQT